MKQFLRCEKGNFYIATAVILLPLIGMTGYAIDYSRIQNVKTALQDQADAASIAMAKRGPAASLAEPVEFARQSILAEIGADTLDPALGVRANWDGTDVEVFIDGKIEGTLMRAMPGMAKQTDIAIYSRARTATDKFEQDPPEITFVDPKADQYNRLYFYCLKPKEVAPGYPPANPNYDYSKGRDGLTPIKDNAEPPTNYDPITMPDCGEDGFLNYYIEQMGGEHKKAPPPPLTTWPKSHNWGSEFQYGGNGDITHMLDRYPMETIQCKTLAECKPKSEGGKIPEGIYRTPLKEFGACPPGEYRYHGYEDGTDNDFNDISVVMPCPSTSGGSTVTRIYLVK